MISPFEPETSDPDSPFLADFSEEVSDFFVEGGHLAGVFEGVGRDYRSRMEQQEMARAVCDAFQFGEHLAVEAGTGVGKSFAYLAPAAVKALKGGGRVVISTHTISLQEQLLQKDIPVIQKALHQPLRAVLAKGRSNYLCLKRLSMAYRMGGDLFRAGHQEQLQQLRRWSETCEEGSLQEVPFKVDQEVWEQVCADEHQCMWPAQKDHAPCFLSRSRRAMQDAHILVVNHHLFFADLALRSVGGNGILPDYDTVVFDEAHELEDVASAHFGIRLTPFTFDRWARKLWQPEARKGLLIAAKLGSFGEPLSKLRKRTDDLFARVQRQLKVSDQQPYITLTEPPNLETNLPYELQQFCYRLGQEVDEVESDDLRYELQGLVRRGRDLSDGLQTWLEQGVEGQVYWVEWAGRRRKYVILQSAPIDIAAKLQGHLFEPMRSVVLTSATLAAGDDLGYFRKRIGLEEAESLQLGSPYNYAQQMRVVIPENMPEPNQEGYITQASEMIRRTAIQHHGRTFVLCTSQATMQQLVRKVRSDFEGEGLETLVQGEGIERRQLLDRFIASDGAVLFGLASFWAGVDVPGESLTNVIITRLPFAVPDQPLVKARLDRIKQRGGDAFREYSLPEAVLKFRQGVGRLIRSETDEGQIVILDSRIIKKPYGKIFLKALPECAVDLITL